MENNLENLTIGVFAKAAGVNVETIRFYQRKGLLPEPDKPYGSIRRYGAADVTRVRFVKSAQRLCGSTMAPTARRPAAWPSTSSKTCARRWPIWRAWRLCCLTWCAPAIRGSVVARWNELGRGFHSLACFIFRFLRCPLPATHRRRPAAGARAIPDG